ncbi:MAG: F0F1 ATP synthase subunit B [Symploca sp. SIO3E6]|nr:F0F1 ATP synthase subunit B [Caldora sp. SIO3E6]
MMGNFFLLATLLATEAHSAEEGGFGLHLDILESNVINLAILVGVLFYFGSKLLGNTLSERSAKIAEEIQAAEQRQKEAAGKLADQQQKLAQAQAEAEEIRKAAEANAQRAKEQIIAQSEENVKRMKEVAVQDLNSEQERAIAQLRQRVVAMALERSESRLQSDLDESAQQQLIDRSIALLGGGS